MLDLPGSQDYPHDLSSKEFLSFQNLTASPDFNFHVVAQLGRMRQGFAEVVDETLVGDKYAFVKRYELNFYLELLKEEKYIEAIDHLKGVLTVYNDVPGVREEMLYALSQFVSSSGFEEFSSDYLQSFFEDLIEMNIVSHEDVFSVLAGARRYSFAGFLLVSFLDNKRINRKDPLIVRFFENYFGFVVNLNDEDFLLNFVNLLEGMNLKKFNKNVCASLCGFQRDAMEKIRFLKLEKLRNEVKSRLIAIDAIFESFEKGKIDIDKRNKRFFTLLALFLGKLSEQEGAEGLIKDFFKGVLERLKKLADPKVSYDFVKYVSIERKSNSELSEVQFEGAGVFLEQVLSDVDKIRNVSVKGEDEEFKKKREEEKIFKEAVFHIDKFRVWGVPGVDILRGEVYERKLAIVSDAELVFGEVLRLKKKDVVFSLEFERKVLFDVVAKFNRERSPYKIISVLKYADKYNLQGVFDVLEVYYGRLISALEDGLSKKILKKKEVVELKRFLTNLSGR